MPTEAQRRYNGVAIRALRQKSFLNRSAFATAVGIGTPHLSNIEAGRRQPSDELALKMAAVLGQEDLRAIVGEIPNDKIPVPGFQVD